MDGCENIFLLIWMLSIVDLEIFDKYLFLYSNIHSLYLITQILFVNIGVWWYNWRQKGLHILQVGFNSCSACHRPHNWSENAFLVWNGSTWAVAGGMCHGHAYPCIGKGAKDCSIKLVPKLELYCIANHRKFPVNCRICYPSWMVAPKIIT